MNTLIWPIDPKAPKEIKVKVSHEGATMVREGGVYNSIERSILKGSKERINVIKKVFAN